MGNRSLRPCTSEDQNLAARDMLTRDWEPKWKSRLGSVYSKKVSHEALGNSLPVYGCFGSLRAAFLVNHPRLRQRSQWLGSGWRRDQAGQCGDQHSAYSAHE